MELSFVQETLNAHLKRDMTSLRGQQEQMRCDHQQADSFSYLNGGSEYSGRFRKSSDTQILALEEEFRRLLVGHSELVNMKQILDQVSFDAWRLDKGVEGSIKLRESAIGEGMVGSYDASDLHVMSMSSMPSDVDMSITSTPSDIDVSVSSMQSDLSLDLKVTTASLMPSDDVTMALMPLDVISDLHRIACHMMEAGHTKECYHAFISVRKSVIEDTLSGLGLEKLGLDDVQKLAWEDLEVRIMTWIQALKAAVGILYVGEKMLCYQVFGSGSSAEELFSEISKGSLLRFMNFAEGIAIGRRLPEKLFRILDMYEALCEARPRIDAIFSDDIFACVRFEVDATIMRLGEAARGIFGEFENAIQRESSKIPVPGGAIHPLTKYVMNYIQFLFCYLGPLTRLLGDEKKKRMGVTPQERETDDDDAHYVHHLSPLGVQIVWLIVLLECNLDGKSKLYKDVAQTYFFLMNNVHYIVQKVRKSEVVSLLGEDWVRKQSRQVLQHATNYMRSGWKKVLGFVRDEGSNGIIVSKGALRDKLKGFYTCFEDTCRAQSSWVVPDLELREELRISIAEKIITAYQSFLTRHQAHLELGKQQDRYLKYTPEELERCLLDLFEGVCLTPRRNQRKTSLN